MRQSQLLMPTLREVPSEAEAASHQLMLRAGLIRQLAAGIYTYLPLGRRVLRKLEQIVREEMDHAGAQEVLMPALQPAELWQQSGRYEDYGPELVRLRDRHDREFTLGPTHEEVITALVRGEVSSYRQLPLTLYQIQTKFRDEKRPRYGLLRGREFLMKDAYSFDEDWEGLHRSYTSMYEAYNRIFTRCGLYFRPVEADAGSIGGEGGTHEFMALADIGEDTIAVCTDCSYAANLEKAEYRIDKRVDVISIQQQELKRHHTPDIKKIDQLSEWFGLGSNAFMKTLIYVADGKPVAVIVRGDHEVNEIKLKNVLAAKALELADQETTECVTGAPLGFAGPIGLSMPILADYALLAMKEGIAGANEQDYHVAHVIPSVHLGNAQAGDYRNAVEGDGCPRCEQGRLTFHRGIEVGHVFKLGTKYSEALNAKFLNASGVEQPLIMGCYGIGVSRLLSAVLEQHSDSNGIIWPKSIAPYHVHIVPVSSKDQVQMDLALQLAASLGEAGLEVLLDDRDERPGVKFKDSDLIGIPLRIVVGKHAAEGIVEVKPRNELESLKLNLEEAIAFAKK
ncbi:proline--tRNA ligase [Paenibacillus sp. FSL H8-0548]|uniref:proline--tRNA ligase n=1 Tax=Paenibacillus sp. FSL H8-0548 TaxID=1920422 RepID=UPI00096BE002|nr:proline--tRNA ligase [Paenibacillus sp. FSL H8-0548]OMF37577.1 proline--tRNA ligase [Paenibacillus sp. FSL H8-0548]